MPIKLKCSCGQTLTVPDALAGKTGKCPKCQAAIKIPSAAAGASESKPAPAKPAATTAAASSPKSAASKPAATKPAATSPSATKPAATKPAATKPAAGKPAGKPDGKPAATKPAATKPAAAARPVRSAAAGAAEVDALFDEIGLKKKAGPVCPKCGGSITPGAALCTHCGFNMQTGEQAIGFEAQYAKEEFQNPFLQEAADNMQREIVIGERQDKSGMPWWMIASFLLGALCIGAAGIIIVDATFNEPEPADTFMGRLQRQHFGVVIGVTFAAVGTLIATLANLSIITFAFRQSIGRGFAVWFIPLYSIIYGCMTWADNKSGIIGLLVGSVLAGAGIALAISSGGIR
jgi:hypothetical protein